MKKTLVTVTVLMVFGAAIDRTLATGYTTIDLNPSGFTGSYANGISDNQQVGYGWSSSTGNQSHALLWNGSASDYVDLHPSGFTSSYAYDISGNQQVGYGWTGNNNHALLWSSSAESYVDLHPSINGGAKLSHLAGG